jgi:hypothetical protein
MKSSNCSNQNQNDQDEQSRIIYLKDLASQIALETGLNQKELETWMLAPSNSLMSLWQKDTSTQIGTQLSETPAGEIGQG